MKSSSAMLKFHAVAELAHYTEDVLDRLRSQELPLNQYALDLLLEAMDALQTMVRERSGAKLAHWLTKAAETAAPEVRGFVGGVRQDEAAVKAGLTEAWSNGQVEGQVGRLKGIKRQMFGRARISLLRARVRHNGMSGSSTLTLWLNVSATKSWSDPSNAIPTGC